MTNHIEEAIAEQDITEKYPTYGGIHKKHVNDARNHALIAIAEQLRIMNLIKMDEVVVREGAQIGPLLYMPGNKPDYLRPDVAEALGIKEEK